MYWQEEYLPARDLCTDSRNTYCAKKKKMVKPERGGPVQDNKQDSRPCCTHALMPLTRLKIKVMNIFGWFEHDDERSVFNLWQLAIGNFPLTLPLSRGSWTTSSSWSSFTNLVDLRLKLGGYFLPKNCPPLSFLNEDLDTRVVSSSVRERREK